MSTHLSTLFSRFDRGVISRRQLLQAPGIAVAMQPASALAQGQCGGALKGTPQCDPTPAKAPFASTGWKTVLLEFGIAGFEPDAVKAELEKRGLNAREDTGGRGDIHTAPYKSYHTTTPNGYDLQISATTKANRGA